MCYREVVCIISLQSNIKPMLCFLSEKSWVINLEDDCGSLIYPYSF